MPFLISWHSTLISELYVCSRSLQIAFYVHSSKCSYTESFSFHSPHFELILVSKNSFSTHYPHGLVPTRIFKYLPTCPLIFWWIMQTVFDVRIENFSPFVFLRIDHHLLSIHLSIRKWQFCDNYWSLIFNILVFIVIIKL